MKKTILLMVVSTFLMLPSALALNCTLFSGNHYDLCNAIEPLSLNEDDKSSLMQDNVYGQIQETNTYVNLELQTTTQPVITLEDLYEEKIVFIGRFAIFLVFNYCLFSIITKSSFIRKWLIADY